MRHTQAAVWISQDQHVDEHQTHLTLSAVDESKSDAKSYVHGGSSTSLMERFFPPLKPFTRTPTISHKYRITPPHPLLQQCATVRFFCCYSRSSFQNICGLHGTPVRSAPRSRFPRNTVAIGNVGKFASSFASIAWSAAVSEFRIRLLLRQ